jgi:hypothetical protein
VILMYSFHRCLQRIKRGHELGTVILTDAQLIYLFHRFHQDTC